jgi:hypothetical protein
VGFLPHNFNPAKIIMGDAGALFLGYVVAVMSVEGPIKSATTVALFVPVLALGVPIMDAAFAVWRRALRRRSVVVADREHLHHRLLNMGLTQRQAVLVMYSISGFFGYSAFKLTELTVVQAAMLLAGIFSLVLLAARRAGLLGAAMPGGGWAGRVGGGQVGGGEVGGGEVGGGRVGGGQVRGGLVRDGLVLSGNGARIAAATEVAAARDGGVQSSPPGSASPSAHGG